MFLVSMPSKFSALFKTSRIAQTKVVGWLNPILNNLWVLVLIFILISCVFTYHSLQEADKRIRNQVVESLQTVLQTTHGSIFQVWYRGRILSALNWAKNPELVNSTEALLVKYKQGQTLIDSDELNSVRSLLGGALKENNVLGFFLIAPDFTNIGSMRDANMGDFSLMARQRPDLMEQVFEGESVVFTPMASDVPLRNVAGELVDGYPTMFIAVPVKNREGAVIAALTQRLDPHEDFARIAKLSRLGKTGETYIFDRNGVMISNSRFEEELRVEGALGHDQTSILNIKLLDPDVSDNSEWFTHSVMSALSSGTGHSVSSYKSYRGTRVLGTWLWNYELGMGFISEISEEEALEPYYKVRDDYLWALGVLIPLVCGLSYLVWNSTLRSSKARKRSDFYARLIMEQAPDGIMTVNRSGLITSSNRVACDLFGFSEERLQERPFEQLVPETSFERILTQLKENDVSSLVYETEGKTRRGQTFPVRLAWSLNKLEGKSVLSVFISDLTETKETLSSLLESEDRFRMLFNKSMDAVYLFNGRTIFDCNLAAVQMFGYKHKGEIIGKHPIELSPITQANGELTRVGFENRMQQLNERGSFFDQRLFLKADGSHIFAEVSTSLIKQGDQRIVQAVIRDVGHRKEGEQELQKQKQELERAQIAFSKATELAVEFAQDPDSQSWTESVLGDLVDSEHRYQALIDGFQGGIFISALDGKITHTNDEFIQIFSSEENRIEINDQTELNGFFDEMGNQSIEAVLDQFADESIREYNFEYILYPKTNNEKILSVHLSVQFDRRQGMNVLGVVKDITLARKSSEQIRLLSEAVEHSPVSVIITDSAGNIEYANPVFSQKTGYEVTEVLGENINFMKSGLTPAETYKSLWQTLGEGKQWRGEFYNRKKNGELFWESSSISSVRNSEGEVSHYISLQEDITERKRSEKELVKARDLAEQASKAKSDFLAMMSHEIRTPLNAIIGMSHLVKDKGLDASQNDYIQKIDTSADHLLGVINDILDVSKIESGSLELEHKAFSLKQVLDNVVNQTQSRAEEKGVEFEINVDPQLNPCYEGDPLRLGQVLLNLTSNALKFTSQGHIKVNVQRIAHTEDYSRLEFSVVDTGVGISPEELEHIFDPFSQADVSTTRRFGGSGLGLAICKQLVTLMDGNMSVASDVGKGSCFSFAVKLENSEETEDSMLDASNNDYSVPGAITEAISKSVSEDAAILLVEDNAMNQDVVTGLLSEMGLSVDIAENGKLALEQLALKEYQLVLLDLHMPVMDGKETIKAIRSDPGFKDLTVIAMTADAMETSKQECLSLGMDDFISKPVNVSLFIERVSHWLNIDRSSLQTDTTKGAWFESSEISQPEKSVMNRWQHISMESLWELVNADTNLMYRILDRFLSNQHEVTESLYEATKQNDSVGFTNQIHTLKGNAGNIGAVALSQMARDIEMYAKSVDGGTLDARLLDRLSELEQTIQNVCREIQLLLDLKRDGDCVNENGSGQASESEVQTLLNELRECLEQRNVKASKVMESLMALNTDELLKPALKNELNQQISRYQFKPALTTLKELMNN